MKNNTSSAYKKALEIKKQLQDNSDIIIKKIAMGEDEACLIFLDELTDQEQINLNIINPMHNYKLSKTTTLNDLLSSANSFCMVQVIKSEDFISNILKGFAVLLVPNEDDGLSFNVIKHEGRSVEEPPSSTVINGPREGFTENIKTNVSLIRKRIISPKVKIEDLTIGVRTQTAVKIIYFTDLVDMSVVKAVKKRLGQINIDGILDSYNIATLLENKPNSMFRQVGSCEKPDIACAKLLEGRLVILVDGSPIALTLPFVLFEDFQSSNDYYSEAHRVSTLRILRIIALIMSIYLPGAFMALQLYHYRVLPLKFLVTIINTTQNLPLNPFLEIFFIIVLFEILFEASLRMPKYLGIAVSIVGALILGDTAVKAGLVSPPGVMIVAMSAITIYIIPNQSAQISLLRVIFAFIGGVLGFHGLILGSMYLFAYLANFDSYNTPYLAPFTPYIISDQKDFIFKDNIVAMTTRPECISTQNNRIRQVVPKDLQNKNKIKKEENKQDSEKPKNIENSAQEENKKGNDFLQNEKTQNASAKDKTNYSKQKGNKQINQNIANKISVMQNPATQKGLKQNNTTQSSKKTQDKIQKNTIQSKQINKENLHQKTTNEMGQKTSKKPLKKVKKDSKSGGKK